MAQLLDDGNRICGLSDDDWEQTIALRMWLKETSGFLSMCPSDNGWWERIAQLEALATPVAFKDYFQTEVDQINTAMSRISMLVEKAREDEVLESPHFRDNFAELMRQVDEMSDNLRLYNEQYTQTLKP